MDKTPIEYILSLENNDEYHMARLLILLEVLSGRNHSKKVAGITKLAKLDYLLRYPVALERSLRYVDKNVDIIEIKDYERYSIESRMIRFKYGPWDIKFRRLIVLLQSKGLVNLHISGKNVEILITDKGIILAQKIAKKPEFRDYYRRSKIIKTNFDEYSASRLTELFFDVFPELSNMRMGEIIEI